MEGGRRRGDVTPIQPKQSFIFHLRMLGGTLVGWEWICVRRGDLQWMTDECTQMKEHLKFNHQVSKDIMCQK